jgi:diaminopimelate decarboxylase
VAAGVTVELESNTEMRRVVDVGEELGVRPSVALRVNPNFEVKGSGMRMGGGPQQFGVDAEDVPALLRDTRLAGLDFKGFHVFAGSQNLMAEVIVQAQRRSVEMVAALSEHAPGPITYLNLGGGFGIPYSSRDKPLELEVVGDGLQVLLDTMIGPLLGHPRTVIELGRYIVGECGVYVTRIVDRKTSRGRVFLVVDGGMHHQLAASGNLGQVIRRNYPLAIGNRMGVVAEETATVVGCLCTPLDILGDRVEVPRADIGDLVVVFQAGAYGLTASPTAFLGHPMPAEVLL